MALDGRQWRYDGEWYMHTQIGHVDNLGIMVFLENASHKRRRYAIYAHERYQI